MSIRPHPPLRAMPLATGLALLVLVVTAIFYGQQFQAEQVALAAEYRQRLATLTAPPEPGEQENPRLGIVGIGSSLLQQDTYPDSAMESFAARSSGLSIRYVRMARSGRNTWAWQSLMEHARVADCDLVLVEDTFLFYRPKWLRNHYRSFRAFCTWHMAEYLGFDHLRAPPDGPATPRRMTFKTRERIRGFWSRYFEFGLRPGSRQLFANFRQAGIQVVVLVMPLHDEGKLTRDPQDWLTMEQVLGDLEADGLVRVLRCPLVFDRSDYSDLRHLMPSGREKYCVWLLRTIAELVGP